MNVKYAFLSVLGWAPRTDVYSVKKKYLFNRYKLDYKITRALTLDFP